MDTLAPIPFARTNDSAGVASLIAEHFQKIGDAQSKEERAKAMDSFAQAIFDANAILPVMNRLLSQEENGRRIVLEIGSRLPRNHDPQVRELLLPLLGLPQLSSLGRTQTAARLLAPTLEGGSESDQILQAYTGGASKAKAIERLQRLQEILPQRKDVALRMQALQSPNVESCGKCGLLIGKTDLIEHAWKAHGLLVDGDRLKEPWQLISDWLENYEESRRPEWLSRCCEVVKLIDPVDGYTRLRRLLLADTNALSELREQERLDVPNSRTTLCPECLAINSAKEPPVEFDPPSFSGDYHDHGFRLELHEGLWGTRLFLQTPQGMIYDGPEPGAAKNPNGQLFFLVLPLVLLALISAIAIPSSVVSPIIVVSILLGIAGALGLIVGRGRRSRPRESRIVDHAWSILGPTLHQPQFSDFDSFFLDDLALASLEKGTPQLREASLQRLTQVTLAEVRTRPGTSDALAPLIALQLDDARKLHRDLMPLFAQNLSLILQNQLPISRADVLLKRIPFNTLSRSDRARLRVLILGYAFEIGWEVSDLRRLGRLLPGLGQLYASEDLDGMARLRWLWQAKGLRPWQRIGSATTVFDLARYPMMAGSYLESNPDMLLFQTLTGTTSSSEQFDPILVCEEGVVYQKAVITGINVGISISAPSGKSPNYRLHLPDRTLAFSSDPSWIATRLQAWAQFLYRDFLPQAPLFANRRSLNLFDRLLQQKRMTCSECHSPFLSVNGNLGVSLNELEVRV